MEIQSNVILLQVFQSKEMILLKNTTAIFHLLETLVKLMERFQSTVKLLKSKQSMTVKLSSTKSLRTLKLLRIKTVTTSSSILTIRMLKMSHSKSRIQSLKFLRSKILRSISSEILNSKTQINCTMLTSKTQTILKMLTLKMQINSVTSILQTLTNSEMLIFTTQINFTMLIFTTQTISEMLTSKMQINCTI